MKRIGRNTTILCCIGIVCIAELATVALLKGIDGTVLLGAVTVIGGIVGGAIGFRIRGGNSAS